MPPVGVAVHSMVEDNGCGNARFVVIATLVTGVWSANGCSADASPASAGLLARFIRWMARIDQPTYVAPAQGQQRQPQFLGDVIGSLSQTLRNVNEQSVTTADNGDRLTQTIVYRMP